MPEQNLNLDALLDAMDTLMSEVDADPRAAEWARKVVTRVVSAYLSALPAQPDTVNSVEEIPAKIQIISWEEEPEHECWKLAPDETFVGLIVKAGRSWSAGDQYTLNISRPVEG